jgi:hypothetical protein
VMNAAMVETWRPRCRSLDRDCAHRRSRAWLFRRRLDVREPLRAPLSAAPNCTARSSWLRRSAVAHVAAGPFRLHGRARRSTLPTRCKPRRQRSACTTPPIRARPTEACRPLSTSATHTRRAGNVNCRIRFQATWEGQLCGNVCSLIEQTSEAQETERGPARLHACVRHGPRGHRLEEAEGSLPFRPVA